MKKFLRNSLIPFVKTLFEQIKCKLEKAASNPRSAVFLLFFKREIDKDGNEYIVFRLGLFKNCNHFNRFPYDKNISQLTKTNHDALIDEHDTLIDEDSKEDSEIEPPGRCPQFILHYPIYAQRIGFMPILICFPFV